MQEPENNFTNKKIDWQLWQLFFFRFIFLFVILFACSFSFPHYWLPDIGRYTHNIFESAARWAGNILGIQKPYTTQLISDSTGFYLDALFIFFMSMLIAFLWSLFKNKQRQYDLLLYLFLVLVRYYLALQLMVYGLSKIFKWQFYLPEPNTLFTTIGNTPQDLLFWSTMGMSRSYSIFTGSLELIAALLLFFRRTTLAGGILALALIMHVAVLNFSFDISVKLYSLFLLFLSTIIIAPNWKNIVNFFWKHQSVSIKKIDFPFKQKRFYPWIKCAVVLFLIADSMAVYFETKNFNDDNKKRPFLHGAYEVSYFIKNGDTLPPLLTDSTRWRRMFIHRKGYLITQMMNDDMQDYELEYDTAHHYLWINLPGDSIQTNLKYTLLNDTSLQLDAVWHEDELKILLKKIDLSKLPAMQHGFHWTIDE